MFGFFCKLQTKNKIMDIFNIKIWGEDADKFMALSCDKKKTWIKKHTNQKNDSLIEEFLKAAVRGNDDECAGCKEKNRVVAVAEPQKQPSKSKK